VWGPQLRHHVTKLVLNVFQDDGFDEGARVECPCIECDTACIEKAINTILDLAVAAAIADDVSEYFGAEVAFDFATNLFVDGNDDDIHFGALSSGWVGDWHRH